MLGSCEGDAVGSKVVGDALGFREGRLLSLTVGLAMVSLRKGDVIGSNVDGDLLGLSLGEALVGSSGANRWAP